MEIKSGINDFIIVELKNDFEDMRINVENIYEYRQIFLMNNDSKKMIAEIKYSNKNNDNFLKRLVKNVLKYLNKDKNDNLLERFNNELVKSLRYELLKFKENILKYDINFFKHFINDESLFNEFKEFILALKD